jgi:hypothetical protein
MGVHKLTAGDGCTYFTGNTTILNAEELHHSAGRHPRTGLLHGPMTAQPTPAG